MTDTPASIKPLRTRRAKPAIREHRIPTPDSKPYIAVEGPDGNLWFCESGAAKIGCLDPNTGMFREFVLPAAGSMPVGIAVGGDGNLWFTEKQGNASDASRLAVRSRNSRCRLPKPAPTALCSDRTAMSGSRRAMPIGWRA
jgi:streptogramin lyase